MLPGQLTDEGLIFIDSRDNEYDDIFLLITPDGKFLVKDDSRTSKEDEKIYERYDFVAAVLDYFSR